MATFTLQHDEIRSIASLPPPDDFSDPEENKMGTETDGLEECTSDELDAASSNLKYPEPVAAKSLEEIKLALLNCYDKEENQLLWFNSRKKSVSNCSEISDEEADVLACLGFHCKNNITEYLIECYFCKFRANYTSLRSLCVAHSLFSPNCRPEEFTISDVSTDFRLLSINLYSKLMTYTSKWSHGEDKAVQLANAGFRFNARTHNVLCMSCGVFLEEDSLESNISSYSEFHAQLKPECSVVRSIMDALKTIKDCSFFSQRLPEIQNETTDGCGPKAKKPRSSSEISPSFTETEIENGERKLKIAKTDKFSIKTMNHSSYFSRLLDDFTSVFEETRLENDGKTVPKLLEVFFGAMTADMRFLTQRVSMNRKTCICSICLSDPPSLAITACGHVCSCDSCSLQIPFCPMCRGRITGLRPVVLEVPS